MIDFRLSLRHAVFASFLAILLILSLVVLPRQVISYLLHGLFTQRLLVSLLGVFCLITLSLLWSTGQRLDTWIFLVLNLRSPHPRWLDWIMVVLTQIGNGVLAFIVSIMYFLNGHKRMGVTIILGVLSLWLVVETLKALTIRTRPFLRLADARVVGYKERGKSFPSGHTSQTFFLISTFVHFYQLPIGPAFALFGLAVLVGITRIYLGMHYPRDVIAGAILGSVWGILVYLIEPYLVTGFPVLALSYPG